MPPGQSHAQREALYQLGVAAGLRHSEVLRRCFQEYVTADHAASDHRLHVFLDAVRAALEDCACTRNFVQVGEDGPHVKAGCEACGDLRHCFDAYERTMGAG